MVHLFTHGVQILMELLFRGYPFMIAPTVGNAVKRWTIKPSDRDLPSGNERDPGWEITICIPLRNVQTS